MGINFSFDNRVAARYEAQRAHPPDVSSQIGTAIAAIAGSDGLVLEIGVGTGRIARPAAAAGCRVVGLDISTDMLAQAQEGLRPFPPNLVLTQADMHHLPYRSRSFAAVLAVHVLHLAQNWQQMLREAVRVLRSGGAFIQGDDWIDPHSVVGRLRDELRARALALSPQTRPPAAGVNYQTCLTQLGGAEAREIIAAEWTTYLSPNERLAMIESRLDAESWFLPEAMFAELLQQLREFVMYTWPNPDEKQPITRRFVLKITRGSW